MSVKKEIKKLSKKYKIARTNLIGEMRKKLKKGDYDSTSQILTKIKELDTIMINSVK